MINTDCPQYKKWIERLLTNPPKYTKALADPENPESACCLGHYCIANKIPKEIDIRVYFNGSNQILPCDEARILNITRDGGFSIEGQKFLRTFVMFFDNYSLANINDNTNLNHKQIGKLIIAMADEEKKTGIDMFKPYESD